MENIFPFVFLGLFYITISPSVTMAKILFGIYTVARLLHTVLLLNAIGQPSRGLTFIVGVVVKIIMGVSIIIHVAARCFQ